jgi:hypothetical protein
MNKTIKYFGALLLVVIIGGGLSSCKKDPSIAKVFVRSSSNELVEGAKVIIIADINSNPPTYTWVDTVVTNGSGFAAFNLDPHFEEAENDPAFGKDYTVAQFDIIVKSGSLTGTGEIRTRIYTTAVETVYLP